MKIKKTDGYDSYKADLSYMELMAIADACRQAGEPIADEVAKSIEWQFAHETPPPGVDEHPSKAAKEDPEIDALLPDGGAAEIEVTPPSAGGDMLPQPGGDDLPPAGGEEEKISVEDESEKMLPAPAP